MTNRGIAVIAIRMLALYCLVQAATTLPLAWPAPERSVALAVTYLVLAGLLWVGVGIIANHMLPARRGSTLQAGVDHGPESVAAAVYAAAGVLLAGYSVPEALALWWQAAEGAMPAPWWPSVTRIAIGLLVFVNAHGLANVTARLKAAGR